MRVMKSPCSMLYIAHAQATEMVYLRRVEGETKFDRLMNVDVREVLKQDNEESAEEARAWKENLEKWMIQDSGMGM